MDGLLIDLTNILSFFFTFFFFLTFVLCIATGCFLCMVLFFLYQEANANAAAAAACLAKATYLLRGRKQQVYIPEYLFHYFSLFFRKRSRPIRSGLSIMNSYVKGW